jgi:hypothetical protein
MEERNANANANGGNGAECGRADEPDAGGGYRRRVLGFTGECALEWSRRALMEEQRKRIAVADGPQPERKVSDSLASSPVDNAVCFRVPVLDE